MAFSIPSGPGGDEAALAETSATWGRRLLIDVELVARYDPARFGQQIVGCGCVRVSSGAARFRKHMCLTLFWAGLKMGNTSDILLRKTMSEYRTIKICWYLLGTLFSDVQSPF